MSEPLAAVPFAVPVLMILGTDGTSAIRNPWWVTSLFHDIDDVIHAWELLFKDVLDTHIPTRRAKIRKESLPWVTGEIRKEMNKRYKLLRKCDGTSNTSAIWEEYKGQETK